jgi:pilus assembly protein CpaE
MATVVSVLKSGGGVGATTLAVQGAFALHSDRVVLLDFDIQFGTAAFQLGIVGRQSLLSLIADSARLDATLFESALVRVRDRFGLLAAPEDVHLLQDVNAAGVCRIIDLARGTHDRVLIDMPMAWCDWAYAVLAKSDRIVLVTHLTVPSLRQARRQIDTLQREDLGHVPVVVVANRVEGGSLFGGGTPVSKKEAEKALGRTIDFMVPDDPAFVAAANAGLPLAEVHGHALEKQLAHMMNEIFSSPLQTAA